MNTNNNSFKNQSTRNSTRRGSRRRNRKSDPQIKKEDVKLNYNQKEENNGDGANQAFIHHSHGVENTNHESFINNQYEQNKMEEPFICNNNLIQVDENEWLRVKFSVDTLMNERNELRYEVEGLKKEVQYEVEALRDEVRALLAKCDLLVQENSKLKQNLENMNLFATYFCNENEFFRQCCAAMNDAQKSYKELQNFVRIIKSSMMRKMNVDDAQFEFTEKHVKFDTLNENDVGYPKNTSVCIQTEPTETIKKPKFNIVSWKRKTASNKKQAVENNNNNNSDNNNSVLTWPRTVLQPVSTDNGTEQFVKKNRMRSSLLNVCSVHDKVGSEKSENYCEPEQFDRRVRILKDRYKNNNSADNQFRHSLDLKSTNNHNTFIMQNNNNPNSYQGFGIAANNINNYEPFKKSYEHLNINNNSFGSHMKINNINKQEKSDNGQFKCGTFPRIRKLNYFYENSEGRNSSENFEDRMLSNWNVFNESQINNGYNYNLMKSSEGDFDEQSKYSTFPRQRNGTTSNNMEISNSTTVSGDHFEITDDEQEEEPRRGNFVRTSNLRKTFKRNSNLRESRKNDSRHCAVRNFSADVDNMKIFSKTGNSIHFQSTSNIGFNETANKQNLRPVVIIDDRNTNLADTLVKEYPNKFCRCHPKIEEELCKTLSGTISSFGLINKNCHNILEVQHSTIDVDYLHSHELKPIIILIRHHDRPTEDMFLHGVMFPKAMANKIFDYSLQFEKENAEFYSAIIVMCLDRKCMCFQIINAVEKEQKKVNMK